MSSDQVRVRYDGPALASHSMEVTELAPALLAIGELCKIANRKFNGNRAAVKVLVNTNLDQNCFEFNLILVQTIFEHAKSLITNDNVASAKEIIEWLGIIVPIAGAPWGLFKFVNFLRNRKINSKKLINKDGINVMQISVEGENNIVNVYPQTAELLENPQTVKNVQKIVKPLASDGYETVEFEYKDGSVEQVSKEEAKEILEMHSYRTMESIEKSPQISIEKSPQVLEVCITVHSPVYQKDIKNWKFKLFENHATIDISETDIAEKAIARGGALVNDRYKVKLEITQTITPSGRTKNRYKIKEVIEFIPAL